MVRRCILQIGTEKTGTTTLQAFLAGNRDRLAKRGIRYPRFPGNKNHTGLAAYAMDDGRTDAIRGAFGVHDEGAVADFRTRIQMLAGAELGTEGTVVFCNEHCHSRLKASREVQRLADLLGPHFDRIDVAVYLRRQDQVAVSLYSTRLKSGGTCTDILPNAGADDLYFNYDASLALWEEVFGRANVHVRLFERSELVSGDVVADFLAAWGLGSPGEYRPVGKRNESISAEAQDYLRRMNAYVQAIPGLPLDTVLGPLSSALAQNFPGRGARPSRAEAETFYERFRASNEALRKRHFPARETLFDEDFDGYPDVAETSTFGPDELALIAARLHTLRTRDVLRLEAEIQIRDARLVWEQGDRPAAIALLRRAAEHLPGYPDSKRSLAEHLFRDGQFEEAVAPAKRAADLAPERQDYWHFLGMILRHTGDLEGAAAAQEKSLGIDPDHEPSRNALARIRAEIDASRVAG